MSALPATEITQEQDPFYEAPPSPEELEENGGFLVYKAAGEIYEVLSPKGPGFQVTTQEEADWVLKRIGEYESQILANNNTDAVIHARSVVKNVEAMNAPIQRKRDWLERRYKSQCQALTQNETAGKTQRYIQLPHGRIALRTVAGKLGLIKGKDALPWAKAHCAASIKTTEEVQITKVPKDLASCIEAVLRKEKALDSAGAWKAAVDSLEAREGDKRDEEAISYARTRLAHAELRSLEAQAEHAKLLKEQPKLMNVAQLAATLEVFEVTDDREECDLKTGVS